MILMLLYLWEIMNFCLKCWFQVKRNLKNLFFMWYMLCSGIIWIVLTLGSIDWDPLIARRSSGASRFPKSCERVVHLHVWSYYSCTFDWYYSSYYFVHFCCCCCCNPVCDCYCYCYVNQICYRYDNCSNCCYGFCYLVLRIDYLKNYCHFYSDCHICACTVLHFCLVWDYLFQQSSWQLPL